MEVEEKVCHELKEGLTLALGWLETLFQRWQTLPESQRQQMVAGALLGVNRATFALDQIEGKSVEDIASPEERMASELVKLAEDPIDLVSSNGRSARA
ncbi:MAG: hypothetical protein M3271_10245 [Actinomycetota bacterium]|nr:hypothetical protein [Actinomycetota bacterium]